MEDKCGVVHACAECSVEMRDNACRTGKAHTLAEVVSTALTHDAATAVDASLDGDALADAEMGDGRAECSDDTGCFVTKDERGTNSKVAVAAMGVVMEVGAAEAGGDDLDLGFVGTGRPDRAFLDADVAGCVEDGGGAGGEGERGHFFALC